MVRLVTGLVMFLFGAVLAASEHGWRVWVAAGVVIGGLVLIWDDLRGANETKRVISGISTSVSESFAIVRGHERKINQLSLTGSQTIARIEQEGRFRDWSHTEEGQLYTIGHQKDPVGMPHPFDFFVAHYETPINLEQGSDTEASPLRLGE